MMTFEDNVPATGENNFVQNIIAKITNEREEERIQEDKKRLEQQERLEKAMGVCAAELIPIVADFFSQNGDFIGKLIRQYGESNYDIKSGFIELQAGERTNAIWEYVDNSPHIPSNYQSSWQKVLNQVVNEYGFSVASWMGARDDRANKKISYGSGGLILEWPPYDDGTPLPNE